MNKKNALKKLLNADGDGDLDIVNLINYASFLEKIDALPDEEIYSEWDGFKSDIFNLGIIIIEPESYLYILDHKNDSGTAIFKMNTSFINIYSYQNNVAGSQTMIYELECEDFTLVLFSLRQYGSHPYNSGYVKKKYDGWTPIDNFKRNKNQKLLWHKKLK